MPIVALIQAIHFLKHLPLAKEKGAGGWVSCYVEAEILIKVIRHSFTLPFINISLEKLFLPVFGKIMFAKLRNSLHTICTYTLRTPPPWPPNQQEGRKEGGFPFPKKKSSWDLVDYEQQPQLVLTTLFFVLGKSTARNFTVYLEHILKM